jgi:hypothetical protein
VAGLDHRSTQSVVPCQWPSQPCDGAITTMREPPLQVKKRFADGRKVAVLRPAPGARDAPCPYNSSCGGCTLQELSYDAQLQAKKERLLHELETNAAMGQAAVTAAFEGIVACPLELRCAPPPSTLISTP